MEVVNFFNENYNNIFNECRDRTESDFKQKINQLLIDQNKEDLKNSSNYNTILTEKIELFRKQKRYVNEEEQLINNYLLNLEQKNFDDLITIEKFKNFLFENNINNILDFLFSSQNFNVKIQNEIDNYTNELFNDTNIKVKHVNIILCGNSGVGKSTLINNILKLKGENRQRTGTGLHVTEETKYIESVEVPYIRCADSRGTEPGRYNIKKVKDEIQNFIKNQLDSNDPDKYIHCIWYCINVQDDRFHDDEKFLLQDLQSTYNMNYLPVIIVGTKDYFRESEELKNNLIEREIFLPFIPTVAEKKGDRQPFGLEELKLETINRASRAVESACFHGIIEKIIKTSNRKIDEQTSNIKENIDSLRNGDGINFSNLKDKMIQIFILILNKYSSIKLCSMPNQDGNNAELRTNDRINNYVNNCYDCCVNYYRIGYEQILNSYALELSDIINDFQVKFNNENHTKFDVETRELNINILKPKIRARLDIKAETYYSNNFYSDFLKTLLELVSSRFIRQYKDYINSIESNQEKKNFIISKISSQFEELRNIINNN